MVSHNLTVDVRARLSEESTKRLDRRIETAEGLGDVAEILNRTNEFLQKITSEGAGLGLNGVSGASSKNKSAERLGKARQGLGRISSEGTKILKDTYGIIEDVYKRIVQASPLLKSIESLFNLAVQLFFMPLGTKLATEMLPAILDLVDNVMQIWEGFEGKSLGDLLNETIKLGAEIFGEYFKDLGSKLSESGGILGSIGSVLIGLGDFIEKHGESLLNLVANLVSFIMENLNWLVGFLVGLKIMQYTMGLAQIAATVGAGTPIVGSVVAAGAATAVLAGGLVGNAISLDSYTPKPTSHSGGSIGGTNTNNITINVTGYTDTDLAGKIRDTINSETNLNRLRSGI